MSTYSNEDYNMKYTDAVNYIKCLSDTIQDTHNDIDCSIIDRYLEMLTSYDNTSRYGIANDFINKYSK